MSFRSVLILIGLCAMLSVLGCGSKNASTTTSSPQVQSPDSVNSLPLTEELLLGTWTSSCHFDQTRVGIYIQEQIRLGDATVERTIFSFLDQNCTRPFFNQAYEGNYSFSAAGNYSEQRTSLTITPLSSAASSLFGQNTGLCQSHGWQVNQPQEFHDISQCGYDSTIDAHFYLSRNAGTDYLREEICDRASGSECVDTIFEQSTQSLEPANPGSLPRPRS